VAPLVGADPVPLFSVARWPKGSEPWSLGGGQVAVLHLYGAVFLPTQRLHHTPLRRAAHPSNAVFIATFFANFRESPECELRLNGVLRSSARKRGAKARWLGAESRSLGPSSAPLYLPEYPLCLLLHSGVFFLQLEVLLRQP
jgi:hypothetical protein